MTDEIVEIERQIFELNHKLSELRRENARIEVPHYDFDTLEGRVSLRNLFGERELLLVIHNMGQGCRYCTLWADGLNGFVPHLESAMALALVSKDAPEDQRRFANSRGWRFRLASHGGGAYIREQTVTAGENNAPGAVLYERRGDRVFRKNACAFGPGDLYCPAWQFLAMAGMGVDDWTPQYRYWGRPRKLDDGGQDVRD